MRIATHGQEVPEEMLGELRDGTPLLGDGRALRTELEDQGYLLLRGLLNRDAVLEARKNIFERMSEVGEIRTDLPLLEGIASGTSRRAEMESDLGAFWKSVSRTPALLETVRNGPVIEFYETLLGGPVRPFDFIWLRTMAAGRASGFHFDHVYMNRGTDKLFSSWIPLGDIAKHEGTLLVVEGGHKLEDLVEEYRGFDVDKETSKSGTITTSPVDFARERGLRLLTSDFRAGDMMVLSMFNLHGSLDNNSPEGKVRLSCDARYQLASDPIDERWIGEDPIGHGGGYGGIGAAQPLNSEPLYR